MKLALEVSARGAMLQKNVQRRWANTQIELSHVLLSEISGPKGFESQRQALEYVRGLFVKYNDLLKKFDDIYETMLHPQKRLILRLLLDGIVGRLVELKQELIRWDSCEYTYFEDMALDQHKTLDDLAVEIPRYFAQDRGKVVEQRNRTIQHVLDRLNPSTADVENDLAEDVPFALQGHGSTLAAAVRALQAHERARQGRVHAYLMHKMKNESKTKDTESSDDQSLDAACLIIQTIWRQKYAEKLFNDRKADEARLLNMILIPRKQPMTSTADQKEKRRALRVQYEKELAEAANDVREEIRQYEAVDVKARLEQVLVQWLLESRQLYGQFPSYPPPELNGSSALFKEMSIAEVQDFVNKQAQILKAKKKKPKSTKKPVKPTRKQPKKKKSTLNELQPSKFLSAINDQMGVYKELFHERDDRMSGDRHYDLLLVMDHFRPGVEDELRQDVDLMLRHELVALRLAVDNAEDKPAKKGKKKKKKAKKKNRKKKVKDPVADRTIDSIFEELVETGIIQANKPVRHEDFIGDYQYLSEIMRHNEKEPMPSLLDCQQLVILQIIFPLCSANVHLTLQPHKTVLLAGPRGSGKEMLVHIACNELGGLLLDLSPANLITSFNTADGLKILFAMIKRLAMTMAPILCMIRDTELLFAKKLTAQEKQLGAGRLKRMVRKFLRKIRPGERIMFVGISSQPSRARAKPLQQIYECLILFPLPNYGSRRKILYEHLIERHHIKIDHVELSVLASLSKGFTAGQILHTIDKVLHSKRKDQYASNNFTAKDFVPHLGLQTPVFVDEETKIKTWYNKTPHGIKRLTDLTPSAAKSVRKPMKKTN